MAGLTEFEKKRIKFLNFILQKFWKFWAKNVNDKISEF